MSLEDLTDLGFDVHRAPTDTPTPDMDRVTGYGRSWNRMTVPVVDADGNPVPPADEEEIVTEATNYKALYDKMTQAMSYFGDNYANWGTMTAQQKDGANRQAQRALANLIRYVRGDLTSGGV